MVTKTQTLNVQLDDALRRLSPIGAAVLGLLLVARLVRFAASAWDPANRNLAVAFGFIGGGATIDRSSRSLLTFALCVIFFAAANPALAADGPDWLRDLHEAKRVAAKDGRDLFIVFTGHGWCQPCELMDQGIFRNPAFVDAASKAYVFVELDFNFEDNAEGKRRAAELNALKTAYLVNAFPTVVLADSSGSVYAFLTGYDVRLDVPAYLRELESAQRAKVKRDGLLKAAVGKTGESRAVLLDEAITCIEPLLGSFDDRDDDPLLHFYGPVVEELLTLLASSDTKKELSDKYIARRKQRDERALKKALFAKIDEFVSKRDYAGAISSIEKSLEATVDTQTRWELEFKKQVYLEWSNRWEDALANCRRLLAIKSLTDTEREGLLDRESVCLAKSGRIDEAIAQLDRRIATADSTPEKNRALYNKAQMLYRGDRIADSIDAWRTFRATTKPGTDNWLDATLLLGRELRRDGRHEDALDLFNQALQQGRDAWILLDAAESCLGLNCPDKAISLIEEAHSLNSKLANSERKGDRDNYQRVETWIKGLKEKVSASQTKTGGSEGDRTKQ